MSVVFQVDPVLYEGLSRPPTTVQSEGKPGNPTPGSRDDLRLIFDGT